MHRFRLSNTSLLSWSFQCLWTGGVKTRILRKWVAAFHCDHMVSTHLRGLAQYWLFNLCDQEVLFSVQPNPTWNVVYCFIYIIIFLCVIFLLWTSFIWKQNLWLLRSSKSIWNCLLSAVVAHDIIECSFPDNPHVIMPAEAKTERETIVLGRRYGGNSCWWIIFMSYHKSNIRPEKSISNLTQLIIRLKTWV